MPESDVLIALGGNLGDVPVHFKFAIDALGKLSATSVSATSSIHRTVSIGSSAGSDYQNAAVILRTAFEPEPLLEELQRIEAERGRVRTGHWEPRPLDLDLILYGSQRIASPRLTVPHPHAWYRRFVLDPACEIAAQMPHPIRGVDLGTLRRRLLPRPLTIRSHGASDIERDQLHHLVNTQFAGDVVRLPANSSGDATFDLFHTEIDEATFARYRISMVALADQPHSIEFLADLLAAALG